MTFNKVDQVLLVFGLCPRCAGVYELLFGTQVGSENEPGVYVTHCGCLWKDQEAQNHDPRPREDHVIR